MRGNRAKAGSFFLAAFAAFLLISMPNVAHAQAATDLDIQKCMTDQQQALSKAAQDMAAANAKVFATATVPRLNTTCLTTLLNVALAIGSITNPFGLIWDAIVAGVIMPIISAVCGMVTSAISAAVSMVKSLLCLPLPSFNLKLALPAFGGGNCNGISLIPNLGIVTGSRAANPNLWQIWNIKPR